MREDEARDRAERAVEIAMAAGASDAEARIVVARRFSAQARGERITKLDVSDGRSLSMRLFLGGRKATLTGTHWSDEEIRSGVTSALEQARYIGVDAIAGLPDSCALPDLDLDLYDTAVEKRTDEARLEDARCLERSIRASDPRIDNSNGSNYQDACVTMALANSRGLLGSYRGTQLAISTSPVASEGAYKRTAHYGNASRFLSRLDAPERVAREAVRRTVVFCGATKPPTQSTAILFDREVAAAVLDDLFAACNAANVAVGNSWLADRIGERIGSELLDIVDDGTIPGALGSSPFDAEGVPSQRTTVFERGVLRSFLFDTYYARRLGARSTGNASGGGVGPNTFFLAPGKRTPEELIAATTRGILVLETIGFATEHASGLYSRGARGIAIRDGELAESIEEFTIAAPFPEILAGIDAVANDLIFDGSMASPSFRVAEMQVSGSPSAP
uniref:Putative Peptidase U62, modulator of DNA gyrase n=1 Tax=mine drainage metagenome TaxID=410659 RepID=E6PFX4_9ZZZZ